MPKQKKNYLKNFFMVEIRNERLGGMSPSTLGTAWYSWIQAPNYVLRSWTKARKNKNLDDTFKKLNLLLKKYGENKKLKEVL